MGLSILSTVSVSTAAVAGAARFESEDAINTAAAPVSWIIGWKKQAPAGFVAASTIVADYPEMKVTVAKPGPGMTAEDWLRQWDDSPAIAYLQPNHRVSASAAPNDPLQPNQNYLQLIHANEAWNVETGNTAITIAVVDTGVDLTHPDLQGNLVPGVNLLNPASPPSDDNGHGTNVAGVIAAVANNDAGIAGLLWRAKVMPIKALDADGRGDEDKLGAGIRYAVDHGARIVVLSLGLNKWSRFMSDTVAYAEAHGVLLVAAAGNVGNTVEYPAAYPTVFAVGGAADEANADDRSNFGPELDLMAPWEIFSTALGGGYEYKDGTSMAAPQVAAVCALIWAKYPDMLPYQVRDMIRQSAEDMGQPGWDEHTGYGLLRADRALSTAYKDDMFEPNDHLREAKALPLQKTSDARLAGLQDRDWYEIDAPYDGSVTFQVTADADPASLQLHYYKDYNDPGITYSAGLSDGITIPVKKGQSYIMLQQTPGTPLHNAEISYHITPQFHIYHDPFEDNDQPYKAYVLAPRSQTVTGTLDKAGDQDWFMLPIDQPGTLRLKVSVDTARIDPVLLIRQRGQKDIAIDQKGDGGTETSFTFDVQPDQYYIRVGNIPDYAYAVTGEYTLQITYTTQYVDPNEPNDKSYEATQMRLDEAYEGILDRVSDFDWFAFRLPEESLVDLHVQGIPSGANVKVDLVDATLKKEASAVNEKDRSDLNLQQPLKMGLHYIRLTTDQPFATQLYSLKVHAAALVDGYADIKGNWAQDAVVHLTNQHVLEGDAPYFFHPDRPLKRAEAAAAIVRAFALPAGNATAYRDVAADDWFYPAVTAANAAHVLEGYPDGSFRPDEPTTRMELAAMVSRALRLTGSPGMDAPFADTDAAYWGTPVLRQLHQVGLIQGYADGTFRPEQPVSRAECAAILARVSHD